jgi:hypothetical protein
MSDVRTLLAISMKHLPKHCYERVISELNKGHTEQMKFYVLGVIETMWLEQKMTLDEFEVAFSQLNISAEDYANLNRQKGN